MPFNFRRGGNNGAAQQGLPPRFEPTEPEQLLIKAELALGAGYTPFTQLRSKLLEGGVTPERLDGVSG